MSPFAEGSMVNQNALDASCYKEITHCRICGNADLDIIINLGQQCLTGIFPKSKDQPVSRGPLELIKCREGSGSCGLVQLRQSYNLNEMYGQNYGYRSGLNRSMVRHLQGKVAKIIKRVDLRSNDLIVDIGSNDSTLLQAYPSTGPVLVGIDPTGKKFGSLYPPHIRLLPEFFSADLVREHFPGKQARVVTSIAMFYDLEAPLDFMRQIGEILADDGIWMFEQSYLPSMLQMTAYDTICHEHLEYYGLKQIAWMTARAGLKILDVELNSANGGSFEVTVAKACHPQAVESATVQRLLREEAISPQIYEAFAKRVYRHREQLQKFVYDANAQGKKIFGYGGSTKGNVILQFCGFSATDIPYIAEVNEDKFDAYTPGTHIPMISEAKARAMRPDYFLVLPWHFKANIIEREKDYLSQGGKLVFPLPALEVVSQP